MYEANQGILGTRYEHRILRGDYRAIFSDQNGIYYHGAENCYRTKLLVAGGMKDELVGKVISVQDCGLFLPHDANKTALVYVVLGNSQVNVEQAVTSSALANTNNISALPLQSGVGAGVATGLVYAIIQAEQGRFMILPAQPDPAYVKSMALVAH